MAFIAGYVAERPQPTEVISRRVRAFSILPGESPTDYQHCVVRTRSGHLIAKYKAAHPIRPGTATDASGNALATLGFVLPQTDVHTALAMAAQTSGNSLERAEGEFVAVFVEGSSGRVHIVNDRLSSRPFYLLRRDSGVYFSSNVAFLLALAGQRHRPDVTGWLEVYLLGHTLGARTTVDGVTRLGPGRHLTISADRICDRQYWRLEHRPDRGLDPDVHSEKVFESFRESVEQRARLVGRGVVGLSGGLDSRLLAGVLPPDTAFSAFTFVDQRGAGSTPQTRAATSVAAALGLPHHVEELPIRVARSREVIGLTGGMRPYHHMAIVMAYVEELRRSGLRFSMGGGPGDSLAGAFIPSSDYTDPSRTDVCMDDALRRKLAPSASWNLVFQDDATQTHRHTVEQELVESLAATRGPTAAHRITAWAMTFRQPAFTFTSVLHTHPDVGEAFPHLGYRYVDLMLQLPAPWLYQKSFYRYMIYRALPKLRHIPYANVGHPLSGRIPTLDIASESTARRLIARASSLGKRAAGRVGRSIRPARPTSSLLFSDTALFDDVEECLHSSPALRDIVHMKRCERLLAQARTGVFPSEEALGVLTALCVGAGSLLDGTTSRREWQSRAISRSVAPAVVSVTVEVIPFVWSLWSSLA